MMFLLITLGVILLAFVAVLTVRTLRFTPKPAPSLQEWEADVDGDRAVESLRRLVRCKTVSFVDPTLEDDAEFEKLIALLPELYPSVFRVCSFERLPDRALLFKWSGKTAGDPAVMMSHYDVVPAREELWEKPPFEAVLENGVIWGRGTLDTKVTFNGILSAAEHLIDKGFVPEHDICFAFSGGEEINGMGAVRIVEYFEQQGITPSIVVDEGGAVVENVFPGVKTPCGLIGIAEKGLMNVRYSTKSSGGHASAPKPHTPVGVLSKACCRVENAPFPCHLSKPAFLAFFFVLLIVMSERLNKLCPI